ncbi:maltose/maltodextrin ABC transporter substrate-binding protein MalE [Ideonella paludis]|uniref:maltose/maltodextrin ABC transporter substrate-binding protein MalE n=1 Tax=Ideonella paludis TaxID=1233411 RepID=UPI0036277471
MDSHRRQLSASALAWGLGLGALPGLARAGQRREPLIVWFTVEGAKGMRRVAEAFTRDTGVPVVVETPDPQDGPSKFQQASSAGKGPDIYIYAHDRVGEWVAGGLLHEVHPSRRLRQDIAALGWQGFTWRGRQWGYPIALEAITLIYNKALVSRPPASFDEIIALDDQLARQGKRAILWDYTNNYFTWPLLAANGGYPFKARADGSYDVRDVGIDHPGAVQGAELLARLIREGRMPAGATYPDMEAAMAQGRVAMMLNGPWSWVNLQRAGIDFGVARLPRVGQSRRCPLWA